MQWEGWWQNMRNIITLVGVLSVVTSLYAAPTTIYRSVNKNDDRNKYYSDRYEYSNSDRYGHSQQHYPNHHYPHYPYPVYNNRPHISVVTPHVQVYVEPETTYRVEKNEEVYLPYGGTYSKKTEYISQYPQNYIPYSPRTVIGQGRFFVEE